MRASTLVVIALGLLAPAPLAAHGRHGPLVPTRSGWVEGERRDGAELFLGIPFAAPPVGDLRWRPPVPAPRWHGVRDATALPPACAQLASTNGPGSAEEDCLTLSVYRPVRRGFAALRPLPVLVWIHGGSALNGSGNQFDAAELAAKTGTIVVTLNYRLGVFGFLALPGLTAESSDGSSGNLGLLDQQAALRWVRRNARAFGGNPFDVTIAGQSAGGHSVCVHLASPTAAGLFQRAVIHSGAFDVTAGGGAPCDTAPLAEVEVAGTEFADGAGCSDAATQVECLRAQSAEALLAASTAFTARPPTGGALLPEPVLPAIAAGRWNRVPVLLGSTHDELQPAAALAGLGFPMPAFLYPIAVFFVFGADASAVLAEYPAAAYPDPAFAFGALLTDGGVACPTHTLRTFLAQHTRTYGFEFDDPNAPPGVQAGMPSGAYHTADVQYLFTYSPPQGAFTPEQEALSNQMMRWWAAFAKRGAPLERGEPFWPRFDAASEQVMSLRPGGSALIDDFAADHHCDFWETLAP